MRGRSVEKDRPTTAPTTTTPHVDHNTAIHNQRWSAPTAYCPTLHFTEPKRARNSSTGVDAMVTQPPLTPSRKIARYGLLLADTLT